MTSFIARKAFRNTSFVLSIKYRPTSVRNIHRFRSKKLEKCVIRPAFASTYLRRIFLRNNENAWICQIDAPVKKITRSLKKEKTKSCFEKVVDRDFEKKFNIYIYQVNSLTRFCLIHIYLRTLQTKECNYWLKNIQNFRINFFIKIFKIIIIKKFLTTAKMLRLIHF